MTAAGRAALLSILALMLFALSATVALAQGDAPARMSFDIDLLIKLSNSALSVGAIIYAFFATRREDVDERLKTGSDRMNRHEQRLQAIEQTLHDMPGRGELHALELELVRMNGTMGKVEALMTGHADIMKRLEAVVTRHEEHLLNGGKG